MANVRCVERGGGETADGDRDPSAGQLVEERSGRLDLGPRRTPVEGLAAGMRRDDVPEQHVVLDAELRKHAVNDRRGRLGRAVPRELALGGEGNPADPRAAIAGCLADEHDPCVPMSAEVPAKAFLEQLRAGVLVVRLADLRRREPPYELQRFHLTTSSCARRRWEKTLEARSQSGSSAGWPTVTPVTMVRSSGI